MRSPLNLRPARRLVAIEASGAVLYAMVTLPFTPLDEPKVPDWVSLSGLALLLAVLALNLHTWRRVVTGGVSLHRGGPPVHTARRMADQLRDERRLRRVAVVYVVVSIALLPVPQTWVTFTFSLTVATACLATVTLVALVCSSEPSTRRTSGTSRTVRRS
ncbi:hypothetical protein [Rhodococcus sp. NPDC059234]|uniref:hypothetical protein n=1 Tax=Rhodococcus sp. NPDC059234 TaxID=3346781 RepID=UPI00366FAC4C